MRYGWGGRCRGKVTTSGRVLTAPSTASAVSGADNDTSQRCAPASDPQAVEGAENLKHLLGRTNESVPGRGGATHRDSWCCR